MAKTDFETIDEYLATLRPAVRTPLQRVRRTIAKALPGAVEAISYQIPTFKLDGRNVMHFAGWKAHISVYPVPPTDAALEAAIAPYLASKGTLKFPLDQPIPFELISRVAEAHRVAHEVRQQARTSLKPRR